MSTPVTTTYLYSQSVLYSHSGLYKRYQMMFHILYTSTLYRLPCPIVLATLPLIAFVLFVAPCLPDLPELNLAVNAKIFYTYSTYVC